MFFRRKEQNARQRNKHEQEQTKERSNQWDCLVSFKKISRPKSLDFIQNVWELQVACCDKVKTKKRDTYKEGIRFHKEKEWIQANSRIQFVFCGTGE